MMWRTLLVSILVFAIQGQLCVSRQPGCPEAEEVYPCRCSLGRNQRGTLDCENLSSDEDFKTIIESSKNHRFEMVLIRKSKLRYLPHNLFEDVDMNQLILDDLNLTKVFDSPPETLRNLDNLVVERVRVESGSVWEILPPLKNLDTLNIVQMPMRTVGMDFSQYVPEDIRSLYFNDTDTEIIETGTFDKFTKLQNLWFFKGSIERLDREMFPTPFNVEYIAFDNQKLTEIQEGLFTNMPNLEYFSLIGNQIETIPEKAFDSDSHFYQFYLTDNPIQCDCRIKWLVFNDVNVKGVCAGPGHLRGQEIHSVSKAHFYTCESASK